MKKELLTLHKLFLVSIYVALIFSILALIRFQGMRILSNEINKTSSITASSKENGCII
jgi:hypothetical protein